MAIENGLKTIESAGGEGFILFPTRSTSSLSGNKLLYTYADVNDTARPYGNLFKSFNFPITSDENTTFFSKYSPYALGNLNTTKIIVVEIPKGQYGELIDGKTFQLTIPVMLSGVPSATTLYGTYFGFSGLTNTYIGPGLNSQYSETNSYASQFGLLPSTGNNFNSNVTFLYSNDLGSTYRPKTITGDIEILSSAITINSTTPPNNVGNPFFLTGTTFSSGDIIKIELTRTDINDNSLAGINIGVQNQDLSFISNDFIRIENGITSIYLRIWDTNPNPSAKNLTIKIRKQNSNNLSWSSWSSPSNKFPNTPTTTGKMYARYQGIDQDIPVGILYNDKGIAVITDQTLVSGFRYSAGTSSGYNDIASGGTYTGDKNFAKIYFTNSDLSQSTFVSVTSEFIQDIVCVAGLNEFTTTSNSTFAEGYDANATEKPVFITTIGLYNANKELIGIGKLSEPVKKTASNIVPFSIKLVI